MSWAKSGFYGAAELVVLLNSRKLVVVFRCSQHIVGLLFDIVHVHARTNNPVVTQPSLSKHKHGREAYVSMKPLMLQRELESENTLLMELHKKYSDQLSALKV